MLLLDLCFCNYVKVNLDPRFSAAAAVSLFKLVLFQISAFLFNIVFFIMQQLLTRKGGFIMSVAVTPNILITPKSRIKQTNCPGCRSKAYRPQFPQHGYIRTKRMIIIQCQVFSGRRCKQTCTKQWKQAEKRLFDSIWQHLGAELKANTQTVLQMFRWELVEVADPRDSHPCADDRVTFSRAARRRMKSEFTDNK